MDVTRLLKALDTKTPVKVNAQLDGQATASLTAWTIDGLSGEIEATTRSTPGAGRVLGVNGTANVELSEGEWQGWFDHWLDDAVHLEGHAAGRLAPASLPSSTIAGNLVATADSWPEIWQTLHNVDLATTSSPPSVTGGGRAELTLSGRIDNPAIAGRVEADLPELSQLNGVVPAVLRPSGRLTLFAAVSGTAKAPAMDGRLVGDAMTIAGQSADRLEASFTLTPQTAKIQSLLLTQAGGTLTGNGDYDLRTGQLAALVSADHLAVVPVPGARPDEILAPIMATLSGEWRASGTIADPEGSGELALEETHVLDRDLGRVTTRLTLKDRQLDAGFDLADLFSAGTARLGLDARGSLAIETQTKDADLASLASRMRVALDVPVTGTASFTVHAQGTQQDLAHLSTTLDLQRLDGAVGDVPVRATRPGQASYDGKTLGVTELTLNVGGSELRAAGQLGADRPGTLAVSLDGEAKNLEQVASAFLPAGSSIGRVQVAGPVHVEVRAPGSLDRPALSAVASLDEGRVVIDGRPEAASLHVRAAYDAGVVSVSRFDAAWQGATVSATGDVPIALVAPKVPEWLTGAPAAQQTVGRLRARIESITPAVLAPFVPADTLSQVTGLLSGTLTLDADRPVLSAVHGQLVLDRVALGVAGVPFEQQQPTRVDVANGRAQIVEWNWGGAGNRFSLSGGVQFDGPPTLDVSADGTIDLRVLGAFLSGAATQGRAVVRARVSGAADDPQLDGRIDLQAVEWRNASPRLAITDLNGSLVLSRDDLTVTGVEGQANGGTVSVAGTLKHAGLRLTSGRLAISGRGLALAIPEALKTEADLELTLAVDRGALSLTGDATVLGGSYREPISLASGLLQALELSPASVQLDAPSAADMLALDIRLTTSEDIVVDNNYAKMALAADVRIGGSLTAPTLLGRAEAREGGRIFLGGNVYQIEGAGVVDFSNPNRIEPDLALTALTRIADVDVRMTLKGTPATLETTLTSDPPLSQGEIVSLLVTGQKENSGALAVGSDQVIGLSFRRSAGRHGPRARSRCPAHRTRPGRPVRCRARRERDRSVLTPHVRQAGHTKRGGGVFAKPQGQRQAHVDHRLSAEAEHRAPLRLGGQRESNLRLPSRCDDRRRQSGSACGFPPRRADCLGPIHGHARPSRGCAQAPAAADCRKGVRLLPLAAGSRSARGRAPRRRLFRGARLGAPFRLAGRCRRRRRSDLRHRSRSPDPRRDLGHRQRPKPSSRAGASLVPGGVRRFSARRSQERGTRGDDSRRLSSRDGDDGDRAEGG